MLKIEILDYQYNKSHDLSPLRNCMNLETLFIGGNGISDLSPISGLKNLVNLKITSNPVSDYVPLINLKLKVLQIDDCPIADLEIILEIKSIERIVLSNTNTITNILPLLKLNNLKALELNGLQIDDKQIRQIKEKFTS
jgi:internalin A